MKAVLVSNIPAPYREPVYEAVAQAMPGEFGVLYCQPIEPDRAWKFPLGDYPKIFLEGRSFTYHRIYAHHVHWNPGIWRELDRLDPQVVVTNGYNPSHLLSFLWTVVRGRRHVAMTDGWLRSEEHLSFAHRLLRRLVIGRSKACLGASDRSVELLRHYGARPGNCFLSWLCGDNARFAALPQDDERPFDLLFSGQFIERKMPGFFVEVARLLHANRPGLRLLLLGDGPLRESTLASLREAGIDFEAPGFLGQEELPSRYASARLFLFPTLQECWGVVANEACAAGTPVVTCDNTAVDGELVVHGENGLVLPLDAQEWAREVGALLDDVPRRELFSRRSRERVAPYTYAAAAEGIVAALQRAGAGLR